MKLLTCICNRRIVDVFFRIIFLYLFLEGPFLAATILNYPLNSFLYCAFSHNVQYAISFSMTGLLKTSLLFEGCVINSSALYKLTNPRCILTLRVPIICTLKLGSHQDVACAYYRTCWLVSSRNDDDKDNNELYVSHNEQ